MKTREHMKIRRLLWSPATQYDRNDNNHDGDKRMIVRIGKNVGGACLPTN